MKLKLFSVSVSLNLNCFLFYSLSENQAKWYIKQGIKVNKVLNCGIRNICFVILKSFYIGCVIKFTESIFSLCMFLKSPFYLGVEFFFFLPATISLKFPKTVAKSKFLCVLELQLGKNFLQVYFWLADATGSNLCSIPQRGLP